MWMRELIHDPESLQQQCQSPTSQPSGYSPSTLHSQQGQPSVTRPPTFHATPSLRNTASTSSTYAPSPQLTRHTPPVLSPASFTSQPGNFSPVNAFEHRQNNVQQPLPLRSSDDRLDLGYLLHSRHDSRDVIPPYVNDRTPSMPAPPCLPMHTLSPFQSLNGSDGHGKTIAPYAVPVRNIAPTCPLDGLLLDFLADRRQQAAQGVLTHELIGPPYPSFLSLVNPQKSQYSHPLSKIFTGMMITFPDIAALPDQVAIL